MNMSVVASCVCLKTADAKPRKLVIKTVTHYSSVAVNKAFWSHTRIRLFCKCRRGFFGLGDTHVHNTINIVPHCAALWWMPGHFVYLLTSLHFISTFVPSDFCERRVVLAAFCWPLRAVPEVERSAAGSRPCLLSRPARVVEWKVHSSYWCMCTKVD